MRFVSSTVLLFEYSSSNKCMPIPDKRSPYRPVQQRSSQNTNRERVLVGSFTVDETKVVCPGPFAISQDHGHLTTNRNLLERPSYLYPRTQSGLLTPHMADPAPGTPGVRRNTNTARGAGWPMAMCDSCPACQVSLLLLLLKVWDACLVPA